MVKVFDYTDYRAFLKDYYKDRKQRDSFFSYRFIGNRVGMDSSYVIKVLQGTLQLPNKNIEKFIDLLQLDKKEAKYFQTLVLFNKAKSDKESQIHFEALLALKELGSLKLEKSQYEFFKRWYYSAVWALLNDYKFKGDYKELANKLCPSISINKAKATIKLLTDLKLIEKDHTGVHKTTERHIGTDKTWESLAISQFQKQMIKLGEEALERFQKSERNISTLTLNISSKALPEIEDITANYRQSLKKLVNSYQEAESVFQINVQVFPLTQRGKGK